MARRKEPFRPASLIGSDAGGAAQRLTSHPAEESRPAISPDGTRVAFSARYEGPAEVYVIPLEGGVPRRLSWEGGTASVVGWTPRGEVLYATRRFATLPDTQLAAVDPTTGRRSMNLWSMGDVGTDLRQHTTHDGGDVQSPSLSGGRIVYQLGADLRLYDASAGADPSEARAGAAPAALPGQEPQEEARGRMTL